MNKREIATLRRLLGQLSAAMTVALVQFTWTKKERTTIIDVMTSANTIIDALDKKFISSGEED